jgi:methylenetetrahydrofolate--tRNA-(uracil-5-)-methyltransferase
MNVAFWQNRTTRTAAYQKRQQQELQNQDHLLQKSPHSQDKTPELTTGDYLNIPLNKDEYFEFVKRLLEGDKVPFHAFESPKFFSGCQPIEALAESGPRTLSFGPMKARGITNPHTGRSPWACVQLRRESLGNNAFNMVGFQTRLTWPAQKEIFRTLPALHNAEFFRMGSMHRNTYFCAPQVLSTNFSLKNNPKIFLAGQIMGVEGYIESAAIGLYVGHVIGRKLAHKTELALPPAHTSLGALMRYIFFAEAKHFVPMNIHWGLFDALDETILQELPDSQKKKKIDKSLKRDLLSQRARKHFASWIEKSQF